MKDTLLLVDRVRNTIALGEGQFREFKSALQGMPGQKKTRPVREIADDIAEALVAFANADGGELLIGVEDNGSISGVPHSETEIRQMLEAVKTHVHRDSLLPMNAAVELILDSKRILFFSVSKGTTEIYQLADGRCMRRVENTSMPANANQLLFDRQEVRSRQYDRSFVDGATVLDLDIDLIGTIADAYIRGLSAERYLQQLGLAEYAPGGLRLRMAALLLFAKNVSVWHPRCQVRILKVVGSELKSGENYNVRSDEYVTGNIFYLLQKAWEDLRPFLANRTEFGSGGTFEQKYIYPELACREALVNALAHRDYSSHTSAEVFVFDDRMEFKNPGALLSTLSVADLVQLEGVHESRNALIAKVLRESKFMRELGEGMKRIFSLMSANELQDPVLSSTKTSFSITLPHRSVFSAQQEEWLHLFAKFELTSLQKKIVVLGMNERKISVNDIYKAINTNDRNVFDPEVTGLRRTKILEELLTNSQAAKYARRERVAKGDVPRFSVHAPPEQGLLFKKRGEHMPEAIEPHSPDQRSKHLDASRTVYVSNLPYKFSREELAEFFSSVTTIEHYVMPKSGNQLIKGFAFVTVPTSEIAALAIRKLNNVEFASRKLHVRWYNDDQQIN